MWSKPGKTKEPDNIDKAYEYVVFLLSLKLRTIGEILKKMADRGYNQQVIDKVIERLKDQKYLDDERYAEIYVENLKIYKTFGFYGIKKKLMERKLPAVIIDRILSENLSVEEEEKIARRFLKKEGFAVKSPVDAEEAIGLHYRTFDDEASKSKQKLANRLRSRGFRGEVISRLLF